MPVGSLMSPNDVASESSEVEVRYSGSSQSVERSSSVSSARDKGEPEGGVALAFCCVDDAEDVASSDEVVLDHFSFSTDELLSSFIFLPGGVALAFCCVDDAEGVFPSDEVVLDHFSFPTGELLLSFIFLPGIPIDDVFSGVLAKGVSAGVPLSALGFE
jgi:hypothetical protein